MERWRWMPEHLGELHVQDNLPEFMTRVFKKGQVIHSARIVVGKVDTPTAVFSRQHAHHRLPPRVGRARTPSRSRSWRRICRAGGGGFFFFGGGDTSILDRQRLRVVYNGRTVDAVVGGLGPGRHPPLHVHPVGRPPQRAGRRQVPVPQQARHLHARHAAARAARQAGACTATAACACRTRAPGRAAPGGGQGLDGRARARAAGAGLQQRGPA